MKYKVGDTVKIKSYQWYNENKNEFGQIRCGDAYFQPTMSKFCGNILTIKNIDTFLNMYEVEENSYYWTDDMLEENVEGPSKFKVNDIVFVKNIGWVRITNSYWDSLANEYIYEAIGLNGEDEYDNINQSNIEDQMLPESENPGTCGNKITFDEYKNNDKEWLFNKLAMLDNITALESIQDIFNHLQQSKYPKSYYECCKVLDTDCTAILRPGYKYRKFEKFQQLIICRDAYWKIAGDEMGLSKYWEPDWTKSDYKFCLVNMKNKIVYDDSYYISKFLAFPTEEMRDAFYKNFKDLIERCKDLL